jgi:hypothetical protein
MGILQTRIWLPQIPLSRFAPLCGTPNPGQKSGTGKSSGTRLENSSRITGKPECMVRRFAASEMWAVTTGRLCMNPKNAAGI